MEKPKLLVRSISYRIIVRERTLRYGEDGLIDVNGDVNITFTELKKLHSVLLELSPEICELFLLN
jgi:hypothetical protein